MAERPAIAGAQANITARAVQWDQDSSAQWTDRHYGFSIIEEQGDELPFAAVWGEGDAEQFATLDEAQAWCQAQVDSWIAKYAVLVPTPWRPSACITDALLDVAAERKRQIEVEGYDPTHDDEHVNDEIAAAACFYAMPPGAREWDASSTGYGRTFGLAMIPEGWTVLEGNRRRELVKAGALILAEIERLDRAQGRANAPDGEG